MGSTVCEAVTGADDLELVGRFDMGDELGDLGGADVVVEFSVPDSSLDNVLRCLARGVSVVVGTTGWDEERLARVREGLHEHTGSGPLGVLIAPNFAIGALLMMSFAAQAARFYESVEVIELHHPGKVDAPSGTAARTARLIAQARQEADLGPVPDATTQDPGGARGADVDGIRVHAGASAWTRRAPGGALRCAGGGADDPARLLRPRQLHARRPRRHPRCARAPRPHGRPRALPRPLT